MVSPHQVGDIVRSYVRIPNTGCVRSANSIICNLAKVSTLAATVEVPPTIPPATNVLTQSQVTPLPNNQGKKRNLPQARHPYPAIKVARLEVTSPSAPIKSTPVTLLTAVRIPNSEIKKIKEENEKLKKENDTLRKNNILFKQLIRNPQRLKSVLLRLDQKIRK